MRFIVPSVTEMLVMEKENVRFAASIEEEQRVFYVAASRAQERLYVTRPSNNSDAVPAGTAPDDWPQSPFLATIQASAGTAFQGTFDWKCLECPVRSTALVQQIKRWPTSNM